VNIDRNRPPADGDLGLWLGGLINDALLDARDAGMPWLDVSYVVASLLQRSCPYYDPHMSTRRAAHRAVPLDGTDAQALEYALSLREIERDEARTVALRLADGAHRALDAVDSVILLASSRIGGADPLPPPNRAAVSELFELLESVPAAWTGAGDDSHADAGSPAECHQCGAEIDDDDRRWCGERTQQCRECAVGDFGKRIEEAKR